MSKFGKDWVRKTSERPFCHKMRGIRYRYIDGVLTPQALSGKPSSVEAEALKRARAGKNGAR